jgi:hypothetical protein
VHRARSGQVRQAAPKTTWRAGGDRAGDAGRAGDGAGLLVHGEVLAGEPAGHGGLDRLGLDHRLVPGIPDRLA